MSKNHVLYMWFLVLWQWKFWTPWKYFVSLGILYWNKIHSIQCYFFVLLNGSHKYYWIGIDVLFHVKISFIEKPKKWTTEKTSAIKFGYFSLSTKYAAASKLQFDEHLFIYYKQPDNRYRITREAALSSDHTVVMLGCVEETSIELAWAR